MAIRDAAGYEQGKQMAYEFIERYRDKFPCFIRAFKEDLPACLPSGRDALLNHLRLPFRHRRYVRTTNLVERSLARAQKDKNNSVFFNREIGLKTGFLSAYQGC